MQALVTSLKEASDGKIKAALNLQLNRNRAFLDELARVIDSLQQAQATETDEQDDLDADEEEDTTTPRTGRAAALNAYMQAVRAQSSGGCIQAHSQQSLSQRQDHRVVGGSWSDRSRSRRGGASSGAGQCPPLRQPGRSATSTASPSATGRSGANANRQTLVSPRGLRGTRHPPAGVGHRLAGYLARRRRPDQPGPAYCDEIQDSPAWSSLQPILGHYRNQSTGGRSDHFPPIPARLHGSAGATTTALFFACGDFNQRLTTWGARSADDLKWVFADFVIKEITVSYRQSKQLNDLARAMIHAVAGTEQNVSLTRAYG